MSAIRVACNKSDNRTTKQPKTKTNLSGSEELSPKSSKKIGPPSPSLLDDPMRVNLLGLLFGRGAMNALERPFTKTRASASGLTTINWRCTMANPFLLSVTESTTRRE